MISKNELLNKLKKYDIVPNKKLGQNFLFDQNILEKIAEGAEINNSDTVIEIGAGPGLLTGMLAEKVGNAGQVIAIEKDKKIIPLLRENTEEFSNIKIFNSDFFDFDFENINEEVKVVGNLPYNIASKIILDLLKSKAKISYMVFLIQKEMAERFVSKKGTKEYGSLTMLTDFLSVKKEILFDVSKNVFIPAPKVTSSLLKIFPKELSDEEKENLSLLERLLSFSYSMRRKKIKTSFYLFFDKENHGRNGGNWTKEKLEELFEMVHIDGNKRIEEFETHEIYEFIIKYIWSKNAKNN